MKLSFSTLSCPLWTFDEIVTTAKDLGIDGIEIRGLGVQMYAPKIIEFSNDLYKNTLARLKSLSLNIPILTSGAVLADKVNDGKSFVEACDYINLASKLNVPYIRVMGTGEPHITDGDFETGKKLYKLLCEYGSMFGVTPLIETNGALSKSDNILDFIDSCTNSGILWDIHHTVVYGNEKPSETVSKLGSIIKHVHVKDSVCKDGLISYKMLGYGDIPIKESVDCLKSIGYESFVSLEWVKRWNPDLQEPGIVLAHFKSYFDNIL